VDSLVLFRDWNDTTGLDLSSWVDVENGGFNPGDVGTHSPVFTTGAYASGLGETYIAEARGNRVMPIGLAVQGSTRDDLNAQFRMIRERLDGQAPILAWTPEGAASATYFRVLYGRLLGSERYDYRRERSLWARRVLEVTCTPFGEGQRRSAAGVGANPWYPSVAGAGASGAMPSNPVIFALPSVGGDRPAAFRMAFTQASAASALPHMQGLVWGLIPTASWNPGLYTVGASVLRSFGQGGPTLATTNPMVPGGAYNSWHGTHSFPTGPMFYAHNFSQSGSANRGPVGMYRVLLVARCRSDVAGWGKAYLRQGNAGRVAVATFAGYGTHFQALDMGDFELYGAGGATPDPIWYVGFERATTASALVGGAGSAFFDTAAIVTVPRSWGGGWFSQRTEPRSMGDSALFVLDGLEPERGVLSGWATGATMAAAVPFAPTFLAGPVNYRGDSLEIPYQPSNGTFVPASHMHMVAYLVRGIRESVASGIYGQLSVVRPQLHLFTMDRYTFAK